MTGTSLTSIEISKDYLHFNAAHFTIFSATEREDLHGHTFYVRAFVTSPVDDNGLAFDYNILKSKIHALCDELDEKVLLPERSPHLELREEGGYLVACFGAEKLPFLPRDVLTLPVRNITVEELAPWFVERLTADAEVRAQPLFSLELQVSSGPGQWAAARQDFAAP
ncbi:MAG: 6-pyruvoyl tetrahydropterin synthase family protein [Pseudomonadales bacterium]